MKAKYLFYSLALASAFTACTQDELFDAPALENNNVAGRPVAGVVTFVGDEVESRYNSEAAKFENGDQMGIYLMDEFRGWGEADNANETFWTWQSCWWDMYNMVDYISTNYGYVYNAETGEWINRASQLVEGNYVAMFPQNTRATNRRDLWHPIKANVDLVDHSSTPRYYVNRENQFFVGYEQIMRDQKAGEETGELTANISMKPILTYLKMYFDNQSDSDFKIQKVVFKAQGGKTLPNVAYVKPSEIVRTAYEGGCDVAWSAPWWAWGNLDAMKETLEDECGNLLAWNKYDRTTYSNAAARGMVQYASTADGHIPYGMTDAEATPVYEYVFNFPADADILKRSAAAEAESVCGISIALPMFKGWKNMEVVVYGEMWDQTANNMEGAWRPGIIRKMKNNDNSEFTLTSLKEWTSDVKMDIPSVVAKFDNNNFYQQTEVRVSTTKDLYDLINARLTSATTTQNIEFEVQHYGNGLAITKDVTDLIKNYEKDHQVDVKVEFNNRDRVKTPIILEAEDCIDMFEYQGVNIVVEAPQTITDATVDGIIELRNFSEINLVDNTETTMVPTALVATNIVNEVGATFVAEDAYIVTRELHNEGTLTLSDTTIEGKVSNAATMTVTGEDMTSITVVLNDNSCINCGKDEAVLTIESGALYVEKLTNNDKVIVESGALLQGLIFNNGTMDVKGDVFLAGMNSADAIINIAATGEVRANINNDGSANPLLNLGTINVEGELVENIYNSGVIYVKNSGHVIVAGKVEGEVDGIIDVTAAANDNTARAAKDMSFKNYFRYTVGTETTATALQASLKARISSQNWGKGGSPIILVWGENSATTYAGTMTEANVERIIVENNLTIVEKEGTTTVETKFDELNDYDWTTTPQPANKALWVVNGASLTIDNYATFTLKERTYEVTNQIDNAEKNGKLHVRIDGKFMAKNHSKVNDENVVVAGLGTVEIDTADSYFFWTQEVGEWLGNWDGK